MDTAKLNDWMQVIGIFALVASLLFVGLQMQQSQEIAEAQTQQARTDATITMITSTAENPYFVSAAAKARAGQPELISAEEYSALMQISTGLLYQVENGQYQNARGFLAKDQWNRTMRTFKNMLAGNTTLPVRAAYDENSLIWSAEFRQLVEATIREIEAESNAQ